MKVGVCEWCTPARGAEAVRWAAKRGFDGIAVNVTSVMSAEDRGSVLDSLREAGIAACALALNLPEENAVSNGLTPAVLGTLDLAAAAAKELGAPCIQVPSFPPCALDGGAAQENAAQALSHLCRAVLPNGILVLSENTLDAEGNLRLLDRVGMPNAGVYFDTLNPAAFGFGGPAEMLEKLWRAVGQVHVKDGDRERMGKAPLGEGDAEFFECCRILRREKPDIWIVSENDYAALGDGIALRDIAAVRAAFA